MMQRLNAGQGSTNMSKRTSNIGDGVPNIEDYDVHPKYGFVPEHPATELPEYFQPWTVLASQLQDLVHNKTIRKRIHELPTLDHLNLGDDVRDWRLAHIILTSLAQGYVWVEGDDGIPESLPRQLAVPLKGVADHLNTLPFLTYHTSILSNWKLKDPNGPLVLENMETIVTMNAGESESWFINSSIPVELAAAEGILAVIEAQRNVTYDNVAQVAMYLAKLETSLHNMRKELQRFKDGCDPQIFFDDIKPFISGWLSEPFKKKDLAGLVFEGVSEEPVGHEGLTAAQTSTIPVFDAALGIQHERDREQQRRRLWEFMPSSHRRFIEAVANGPSIKQFVHERGVPLGIEMYNRCVQAVADFRSFHLRNVTSFSVITSVKKGKMSGDPKVMKDISDANTGLVRHLKGLRDSTLTNRRVNTEHTFKKWLEELGVSNYWLMAAGIAVLGAGLTVYRSM